jgi:proteasome lid subunit RPN8/RPN11
MSFRLVVPQSAYDAMIAQAQAARPNECCGMLAGAVEGEVARVVKVYPLVNALASPVEYESEPRSMLEAVQDQMHLGLEVLAVYHSHPTSAPVPSKKDLARNYSEDVVSMIISLADPEPVVRAWWLTGTDYREADWQVV